jgi:hypothetical protein
MNYGLLLAAISHAWPARRDVPRAFSMLLLRSNKEPAVQQLHQKQQPT